MVFPSGSVTKMANEFDPYRKWLGIRSAVRPPDHYRLLGIELFEDDLDVISAAADRQMTHVRTYQTGRHADLSQKLLNELATAKVCLLQPEKKRSYDLALRRAVQVSSQLASKKRSRLIMPRLLAVISLVTAVLIVLVALFYQPADIALVPTPAATDPASTGDTQTAAPSADGTSTNESESVGPRTPANYAEELLKRRDEEMRKARQPDRQPTASPSGEVDAPPTNVQNPRELPGETGDEGAAAEHGVNNSAGNDSSTTVSPTEAPPHVDRETTPPAENAAELPTPVGDASAPPAAGTGTGTWYDPALLEGSPLLIGGPYADLWEALAARGRDSAKIAIEDHRQAQAGQPTDRNLFYATKVAEHMDTFWEIVDEALQRIQPGDEITYRERAVSVESVNPVGDAVRRMSLIDSVGNRRDFSLDLGTLDADLAVALLQWRMQASPARADFLAGLFHAVDRQGRRHAAEQFLGRAFVANATEGITSDILVSLCASTSLPERAPVNVVPVDGVVSPDSGKDMAIPEGPARQAVLDRIVAGFGARWNATTPTERVDLARELLTSAENSQIEPAVRCVCLQEARKIALLIPDTRLSLLTSTRLAEMYDTGVRSSEFEKLLADVAASGCASHNPHMIFDVAIEEGEARVLRGEFSSADRLFAIAAAMSKKKPIQRELTQALRARQSWRDFAEQSYAAFQSAQLELHDDQDAPKANETVGRYRCFVLRDFNGGLEYLEKGLSKPLRDVAQADRIGPKSAGEKYRLAELWANVTNVLTPVERPAALLRARYWLLRTSRQLDVTMSAKLLPQLHAVSVRQQEAFPDVLHSMDCLKTAWAKSGESRGTWTATPGGIRGGRLTAATLPFPVAVTGNYRLRIVFTRGDGNRANFVTLPLGNANATLVIHQPHRNGTPGLGLWNIGDQEFWSRPDVVPGALEPQIKYVADIEVEVAAELTALIRAHIQAEGRGTERKAFNYLWQGSLRDLKPDEQFARGNPSRIAFGADNVETLLHEFRLAVPRAANVSILTQEKPTPERVKP